MSDLKEYVVTAVSYEVLDDLHEDIESPGGNLYIPDRRVEVAQIRPISRSTHYYLTDEEAALLRNDPRVLAVELKLEDRGVEMIPLYEQSSDFWNKSGVSGQLHKNWGLLRVFEGNNRQNWGNNGVQTQTGSIELETIGRNIDVVIVDGHIDPSHPEFAVNPDGTGGSRVVQYNWFQHNPEVTGDLPGNYVYTPYTGNGDQSSNDHGMHVAGIVAGNTQGWARGANIYNIFAYGRVPYIYDYIRAFHRSKPINPKTGFKNPTIINCSFGFITIDKLSTVYSVNYRGTELIAPLTNEQLNQCGIRYSGDELRSPFPGNAGDFSEVIDLMNEGVLVVAAAGNNSTVFDLNSGPDYNNSIKIKPYPSLNIKVDRYYNRGMYPSSTPGIVCTGAVGSLVNETKSNISNCGAGISIFAPGENIMSPYLSSGVSDPRNNLYVNRKLSGTSMASPQVCGLLACVLEMYPNMTQPEALNYLQFYAKNQVVSTSGGPTDLTDLQGASPRYLTYVKERYNNGEVYPKQNYKIRPNSGSVYPRTRIVRYGS